MALLDPPAFRYTVRTPESRHAAIKRHAARIGMTPNQLVQALFDCLDLTEADGALKIATDRLAKMFPRGETTKELAQLAASCGLTARELKVFRALASAAGEIGVITPSPMDIEARSGVSSALLDGIFEALIVRGFIAPRTIHRGRRSFVICKMPDL